MMSVAVQTILVLGILQAVAAVPQLRPASGQRNQPRTQPAVATVPELGTVNWFIIRNQPGIQPAAAPVHEMGHINMAGVPPPGYVTVIPFQQGIWDGPPYNQPGTQPAVPVAFSTRDSGASTSGVGSGVSAKPKGKGCGRIPDPGECRGAFPRYFYNVTLDQCDCFLYGGCHDENVIQSSSWLTLTECNDICSPGKKEEGPYCKLLVKHDIQTYTETHIVEAPDTSHVNDKDFLDALEF